VQGSQAQICIWYRPWDPASAPAEDRISGIPIHLPIQSVADHFF